MCREKGKGMDGGENEAVRGVRPIKFVQSIIISKQKGKDDWNSIAFTNHCSHSIKINSG